MRVRTAIAILLLSAGTAGAADIPIAPAPGGYGHYRAGGVRAEMLVVYDYEPGVTVRAYWSAPWRNRHYFPIRDDEPNAGRGRVSRGVPEPAESYSRYWTTNDLTPPRMRVRPLDDEPPADPPLLK